MKVELKMSNSKDLRGQILDLAGEYAKEALEKERILSREKLMSQYQES